MWPKPGHEYIVLVPKHNKSGNQVNSNWKPNLNPLVLSQMSPQSSKKGNMLEKLSKGYFKEGFKLTLTDPGKYKPTENNRELQSWKMLMYKLQLVILPLYTTTVNFKSKK